MQSLRFYEYYLHGVEDSDLNLKEEKVHKRLIINKSFDELEADLMSIANATDGAGSLEIDKKFCGERPRFLVRNVWMSVSFAEDEDSFKSLLVQRRPSVTEPEWPLDPSTIDPETSQEISDDKVIADPNFQIANAVAAQRKKAVVFFKKPGNVESKAVTSKPGKFEIFDGANSRHKASGFGNPLTASMEARCFVVTEPTLLEWGYKSRQ